MAAATPGAAGGKTDDKQAGGDPADAIVERKTANVSNGKSGKKLIQLERAQLVEWEFKTAGYDIGFAAHFTPTPPGGFANAAARQAATATGSTEEVFTLTRLANVDKVATQGSFVAHTAGELVITFDNTHSTWRSKTINYKCMYLACVLLFVMRS